MFGLVKILFSESNRYLQEHNISCVGYYQNDKNKTIELNFIYLTYIAGTPIYSSKTWTLECSVTLIETMAVKNIFLQSLGQLNQYILL